ncbi:unnamed protein product [Ectocarpus sp. 8 AP-2014]
MPSKPSKAWGSIFDEHENQPGQLPQVHGRRRFAQDLAPVQGNGLRPRHALPGREMNITRATCMCRSASRSRLEAGSPDPLFVSSAGPTSTPVSSTSGSRIPPAKRTVTVPKRSTTSTGMGPSVSARKFPRTTPSLALGVTAPTMSSMI